MLFFFLFFFFFFLSSSHGGREGAMGGPINSRLIFDGSVDAASSSPSSGVGSPPQLLTLERL